MARNGRAAGAHPLCDSCGGPAPRYPTLAQECSGSGRSWQKLAGVNRRAILRMRPATLYSPTPHVPGSKRYAGTFIGKLDYNLHPSTYLLRMDRARAAVRIAMRSALATKKHLPVVTVPPAPPPPGGASPQSKREGARPRPPPVSPPHPPFHAPGSGTLTFTANRQPCELALCAV
eukprot:gene17329-biopygen11378